MMIIKLVNTTGIAMNEFDLIFHLIVKVISEDQGLDLAKIELQMLGKAKKVCQHLQIVTPESNILTLI